MRVLVTRPQEDAEETARLLEQCGHQALVAPLLRTDFLDGAVLTLDGVQAVLATSANGVRALARRTDRRDVPLFAVGRQTAAMAKASGFLNVRDADGDAKALGLAAREWADPKLGALLHVRGQESAGALGENLRRDGFTVTEEILYAVAPLDLTRRAADALRGGSLDAALFFSPRSAQVFRECVLKETLVVDRLIAVCISPAAGAALAPLRFDEIRVADRPNQDAILASLG